MHAQYSDPGNQLITVTLDAGETLGGVTGPTTVAVPPIKGNFEWDDMVRRGLTAAPYVQPPPPLPEIITDRQFYQQLAVMGEITQDEALAAIGTGTIPAELVAFVATLPTPEDQFNAKMILSGNVEFHRNHPMVAAVAQYKGWSQQQTDDLWRAASLL
jgi:hypothetical protein